MRRFYRRETYNDREINAVRGDGTLLGHDTKTRMKNKPSGPQVLSSSSPYGGRELKTKN